MFLNSIAFHANAQKQIIYVSEFGRGQDSGLSWGEAINSVEQAMNRAEAGDEIWVAAGNHPISQFSANGLKLKEGVAMYGGFAGTESSLAERDLSLRENESVINANGKAYAIYNFQNNLTAATLLDGFTISGGTTGGILNENSSPKFSNVIVRGNGAPNAAGGISNSGSSPTFINVKVISNAGAAGVSNTNSSPVLVNCAIINNSVSEAHVTNDGSNPVFINCTIAGEITNVLTSGIGIISQGAGSLKVYNSIVSGSFAAIFGFADQDIQNSIVYSRIGVSVGSFFIANPYDQMFVDPGNGDYNLIACSPAINTGNNDFFTAGRTPDVSYVQTDVELKPRFFGGGTVDMGAYEYQGDKAPQPAHVWYVKEGGSGPGFSWECPSGDLLTAVQFAEPGDQIWVAKGTYTLFLFPLTMKEGVGIYGGFAGNEQSLAARDLSVTDNKSVIERSGYQVVSNDRTGVTSAAVLDGFTIRGAQIGIENISASPLLANLVITGNTDSGISNDHASPVITHCAIVDNTGGSGAGAGIRNNESSPVITNCTIAGHTSNGFGIINSPQSYPIVRNSIIYGNTRGIYNLDNTIPATENSIVQPIIPVQPVPDPLFVDAANKNYRLQPCSPAINTGFNYFQSGQTPDLSAFKFDLEGTSVFEESQVDKGAYQFNGNDRQLGVNGDVVTANVNGDFTFITNASGCKLVGKVSPAGAAPLSGEVTAKVWVAGSQPVDFVKRHYQITPTSNAAGATSRVTLFFTQQEFDDFNAASAVKLPLNGEDAQNYKANLRIEKRTGVSSDDTGLPDSYQGSIVTFKPSEANGGVVWNAAASRWEVSFEVTGFSGFFVKTIEAALPLNLISFTAAREAASTLLQWNTTSEVNTDRFEIQSSTDAKRFVKLATIPAGGSGDHAYRYVDANGYNSNVYYRLKMLDIDGTFTFSKIVSVAGNADFASVFPNPAKTVVTFQVHNALLNTTATLHDVSGRKLQSITVSNNRQELSVKSLPAGMYVLKFADGTAQRFFKQ